MPSETSHISDTIQPGSDIKSVLQNMVWRERMVCKGYKWVRHDGNAEAFNKKSQEAARKKKQLIEVHGNILYDVFYRSNIDTPYMERDVYQHTVQTYLDITYKERYPFRLYLTNRFSNSTVLRRFSDINLQFNASEFSNLIKKHLFHSVENYISTDSLDIIKNKLDNSLKKYIALQQWFSEPSLLQRLILEREIKWQKSHETTVNVFTADSTQVPDISKVKFLNTDRFKFSRNDSLSSMQGAIYSSGKNKMDSLDFASEYEYKKKQLDSLQEQVALLEKLYRQAVQARSKNIAQLKGEISQLNNGKAFHEKLNELSIPDTSLPKGYKTLLSIRSIGIGRTMVDYSELSAKNVSIVGVQVEYNPSYYAAFAGGMVDYRFRDYVLQRAKGSQYVGLVRYGRGIKDGNNIIFTYYNGKRQFFNSSNISPNGATPHFNLMGFTIEAKYKLNKTSFLTAEIAKSSSPSYGLDSNKKSSVLSSAVNLSDHSNEAYSVKLNSFLPFTQTSIEAKYRHIGANFQSFSVYSIGSSQHAWSARVDQSLFHRHLNLTASVRTNDYSNPFVNMTYRSTTVFKSLQATMRIRKIPVMSLGYFPSSQVTKLGANQFQENLFYTLTGSVSHFYTVQQASMLTTLVYTRFYNKASDSGYVYFNTRNLMLSQSVYLGRLTVQGQLSAAANTDYRLYVVEQDLQCRISNWLSMGGGVKYNRQTVFNIVQWGYGAKAAIKIPRLGEVQMTADKGFIPGRNKQLVENKIGRLTYIKVF